METVAIATLRVIRGHGQGRVNLELARGLLASGRRVIVLSKQIDPGLRQHPRVTWVRIDDGSGAGRMLGNLIFANRTTRWLKRYRRELDFIVGNGLTTWTRTDLNIVHFVHSAWHTSAPPAESLKDHLRGGYQWLYHRLNARLEPIAFRRAEKLVAVSDAVRGELIQFGVPEPRVESIPNGVDPDEFYPGAGDRQRLGLPEDQPILLFVGDLKTHRKNLDSVLRSIARRGCWHLAVVGNGQCRGRSALLRELDLGDRVTFLGFRTDLPDIMRAADALACPSRYEPFGLVVLEAMASGLPVIVSRNVGAADRVTGGAGVVVDDPEDVPAICEALDRLSDPARRRAAGQQARAAALKNSWDAMADQYLGLIDQMLWHRKRTGEPAAVSPQVSPTEVAP